MIQPLDALAALNDFPGYEEITMFASDVDLSQIPANVIVRLNVGAGTVTLSLGKVIPVDAAKVRHANLYARRAKESDESGLVVGLLSGHVGEPFGASRRVLQVQFTTSGCCAYCSDGEWYKKTLLAGRDGAFNPPDESDPSSW